MSTTSTPRALHAGIPVAAVAHKRAFWLLLTFFALAMEGFALFNQHVWGLEPCNECIYIRVGVMGIALAGVLGAAAPQLAKIRFGASGLLGASLGWALYRAYTLVNIERLAAAGEEAGCKRFKGFPAWLDLDHWLPEVFEPRGKCGEIVGTFLGQSFAVWSLVALVALALAVLVAVSQPWIAARQAPAP